MRPDASAVPLSDLELVELGRYLNNTPGDTGRYLGCGSFNRAWSIPVSDTLTVVRKKAIPRTRNGVVVGYPVTDSRERLVRVSAEIYGKNTVVSESQGRNARERDSSYARFLSGGSASDFHRAVAQVMIFARHARIVVDGCGDNNYLYFNKKQQGEACLVDYGYALKLRRGSDVSDEVWYGSNERSIRDVPAQLFTDEFSDYYSQHDGSREREFSDNEQMPITVEVTKTLIWLNEYCVRDDDLEKERPSLTIGVVAVLDVFKLNQIKPTAAIVKWLKARCVQDTEEFVTNNEEHVSLLIDWVKTQDQNQSITQAKRLLISQRVNPDKINAVCEAVGNEIPNDSAQDLFRQLVQGRYGNAHDKRQRYIAKKLLACDSYPDAYEIIRQQLGQFKTARAYHPGFFRSLNFSTRHWRHLGRGNNDSLLAGLVGLLHQLQQSEESQVVFSQIFSQQSNQQGVTVGCGARSR